LPDPVGFIPTYLGLPPPITVETDERGAFELPPSPSPVPLVQSSEGADTRPLAIVSTSPTSPIYSKYIARHLEQLIASA